MTVHTPSSINTGSRLNRRQAALLVVGLLLVAANLRPTLTSVGPVMERIAQDTGLPASALGLLTALPLLAFAVVSPLTHRISLRFGPEITVAAAMLVLAGGTILRSAGGSTVNLWLGTFIVGAAIAVGNVLVPGIIRRGLPHRVAALTGIYTAVLYSFAALASGLAVPVAEAAQSAAGAGWQVALGSWALLTVPALLLWIPQLRFAARESKLRAPAAGCSSVHRPAGNIWKSRVAWDVTVFMGLQSTTFYTLVSWLPSIERSMGRSEAQAGWDLFVFVAVGIFSSLLTPVLMRRGGDQRLGAVVASSLMFLGVGGLVILPGALLLWVVLSGLGAGAALVTALTIIGVRARTHQQTTALSGMAQSIGYLLAAFGPFTMGVLHDLSGTWSLPLVVLTGIAALQLTTGISAARNRYVD